MNTRAIVEAALDIEDPTKRQVFIQKACGGDTNLLSDVQSQLAKLEVERTQKSTRIDVTSDFSQAPTNDVDRLNALTRAMDADHDEDESSTLDFLQPPVSPGAIGMLGHYEILQVLGRGGFGIVFKAFDKTLHRLVAIKVMSAQMAATSPPRKRFLREARSAARTKHENIVQVYAVHEEPLPYLVMEYVDGLTLQQKLDQCGPLEPKEVLYLGRQIAAGLAAAHELGLIHRDIKPGNILIEKGAEQKIKITDFGLARLVDDSSMTQTGMISGTPMYMAPEQVLGAALDHRADLFSLGSVLYQMACGRPPFRAPNSLAVMRRVAEDAPRPLREVIPELPDWLIAIVDRLMEKKPELRFQTARELAELMGRYQSELQLHGAVQSFQVKVMPEANLGANSGTQPGTNSGTQPGTIAQPTLRQNRLAERKLKRSSRLVPMITVTAVLAVALVGLLALPGMLATKQASPSNSNSVTSQASGRQSQESGSAEAGDVRKVSGDANESWTVLFDGQDLSKWQTTGPFTVKDGILVAQSGGGNAISKFEYADFELELEWKIGRLGNTGVYYREEATQEIAPGNEYQILDDQAYLERQPPTMQTGSLYGILAPTKAASKPIGEWNATRIRCQGTRVEHWLNGEQVLA